MSRKRKVVLTIVNVDVVYLISFPLPGRKGSSLFLSDLTVFKKYIKIY